MLTTLTVIILAAILIITSMVVFPKASASTAPQQQLIPSLVENNNNYYQNAMDGFRVQVPEGWVMDDIDNTGLAALALGEQLGIELLAIMCPQDQALPAVGGTYRCPIESNLLTTSVNLFRYSNLHDRREFAPVIEQNKNITISDLFAFHIQFTPEGQQDVTDIQIQKTGPKYNNMTTVNVIDPTTNQTVGTAPIMVAEFSYGPPEELASSYLPSIRDLVLLALSNDTNTGFVVDPILQGNETLSTLPPPVQQILDSFELVTLPSTLTVATAPSPPPLTTFQSNEYGFRVGVPNGWVVEDIDSTELWVQQLLSQNGVEPLAVMCPQDEALPVIGGSYTCPFPLLPSPTSVGFQLYRFVDLQARPELAVLADQNKTITTSDLLALFIDYQRKVPDPNMLLNFGIVNNTDIEVNVIDPKTNQTVGTIPAKYVEWTHTYGSGIENYKEFALLVLSNDTNTGYVVRPQMVQESSRETPPFVRQVLDSFELVATTNNNSVG